MTEKELAAIAERLSALPPSGLSLTKWGAQLRKDALALLAEVRRLKGLRNASEIP